MRLIEALRALAESVEGQVTTVPTPDGKGTIATPSAEIARRAREQLLREGRARQASDTAEERNAWDRYAAAVLGNAGTDVPHDQAISVACAMADAMLEERRARFARQIRPEPKPPARLPRPL